MSPGSGPLWEQRWHPFREEWVLFTAHRGGGSMTNEVDPDEKAGELRNTSTRLYRSAGDR